nr:MAG TPA: hypothetical protein [Caudoviricetes sp.]
MNCEIFLSYVPTHSEILVRISIVQMVFYLPLIKKQIDPDCA